MVLVLLGLWLMRNTILTNSLKKIVEEKTNHRVHLGIKSLSFDFISMTVSADSITTTFDSIYIDKSKNTLLDKIRFSGVRLQNFDVWELLFQKQLVADKLIFTKPDVYIITRETNRSKEANPEKVIQALNSTLKFRFTIPARIKKIELRYGQIDVTDKHNPAVRFSTGNLTIFMEDLNTINTAVKATSLNSISKTLYIKAIKLYKSFKSNYAMAVDSLTWISKDNLFNAYGFSFMPTLKIADTSKMLKIEAGKLTASGTYFLGDTIREATVKNLALTNGRLYLRTTTGNFKSPEKRFVPFFKRMVADTLTLRNSDLFIEKSRGDTMLFFKNLNLELKQILLDSLFFKKPEHHFNYKSFKFSTQSFVSNTLLPGLHLQSGKVLYNSKRKKFVLDEFLIRDSVNNLHFQSGRIKFSLSLKQLLKKQKQTFDVFMIRPFIKIAVNQYFTTTNKDTSWFIKTLIPREVKITGGTFKILFNHGADSLLLNNTSLYTKNLRFNTGTMQLKYDTLSVLSGSIAYLINNRFNFRAGSTQLNGNNLLVSDGYFTTVANPVISSSVKQIRLKSFELQRIISDNELSADSLIFTNPVTRWDVAQKTHLKHDTTFSPAQLAATFEKNTTFKINIRHFSIKQGKFKYNNGDSTASLTFKTNYNLSWKHLQTGHTGDRPFSSLKGVQLSLSNTMFGTVHFRGSVGNLNLTSDNGFLGFNNIKIRNRPNRTDTIWNIHHFSINFLGFRNLDYNRLLGKNHLQFGHLLIKGLSANIEQNHLTTKNDSTAPEPVTINIKKLLPFETTFDTLQAENIWVRYTINENQHSAVYAVNNFNYEYIPLAKQNSIAVAELPFFKHTVFRFDSVSATNWHKGFSIHGGSGTLNTYDSTFRLQSLLVQMGKEPKYRSEFNTGIIFFHGISSTESLPVSINIKRINIPHTGLKIIDFQPLSKTEKKNRLNRFGSLYKFSKLLDRFTVNTILFSSVDAVYFSGDSLKKQWTANKVKVKIDDFTISPSEALDTLPIEFKNISADIFNRKFITGDSLYEISARHFSYNYLNRLLEIDSFYVKPLLDTVAFFTKHHWQTDRVNLFVPQIRFQGTAFVNQSKSGRFHFSKIIAKGMSADLYRDKAYPRDTLIRPLLIASLQKIKQPFTVDTLLISDGYFRYSEKEKISRHPGYVFFTGLNITGIHLSNITGNSAGTLTKIFAQGELMGNGKLQARFYFPLSKSQSSQFWFTAKSEKIDLTTLNAMTQPNSGLTILRGKGNIDIPLITANDTVAIGNIMFKYRRLKVGLYNRKKASRNSGIATPLIGFVLNGLVLRSNNPNWFKRPRVGIVYFKRDRNKSIANYIWKSTLSGALSTLGFNNKEQRKRRKVYRREEFDVQREAVKNEKYGK